MFFSLRAKMCGPITRRNTTVINHHTFYMLKNIKPILDKKCKLMKNNFTFMGIHLTEENVIMNTECIVPWNKNKKQQFKI